MNRIGFFFWKNHLKKQKDYANRNQNLSSNKIKYNSYYLYNIRTKAEIDCLVRRSIFSKIPRAIFEDRK